MNDIQEGRTNLGADDRANQLLDQVLVLVDFDNVFGPHSASDMKWFSREIDKIFDLATKLRPTLNQLVVRLYGGWIRNGTLSSRASALQAELSAVSVFPTVKPHSREIVRGSVSLATRISAVPSIEWPDTLKEKRGFPQVRLAANGHPPNCFNVSDCPVESVRRFTKSWDKLCPRTGCSVRNNDAFVVLEQKMVDVMLACDVIGASLDTTIGTIVVMSDDSDIVPAVAMAGSVRTAKVVLIQSPEKAGAFLAQLQPLGIMGATYGAG